MKDAVFSPAVSIRRVWLTLWTQNPEAISPNRLAPIIHRVTNSNPRRRVPHPSYSKQNRGQSSVPLPLWKLHRTRIATRAAPRLLCTCGLLPSGEKYDENRTLGILASADRAAICARRPRAGAGPAGRFAPAAARRAQDAKKDQSKAAKVYDNDNLPTTGAVNVVGQDQSSTGSASATGAANASSAAAKPAPSAKELSAMDANVSAAKELLKNLKADLDIAQRKYVLDQATYYGTPNYASERRTCRQTALEDEKSDIDAKAAEVAAAEKALADVQAKFDEGSKAAASQDAADKAAAAQAASAPAPPAAPPAPPKPPLPRNRTSPCAAPEISPLDRFLCFRKRTPTNSRYFS